MENVLRYYSCMITGVISAISKLVTPQAPTLEIQIRGECFGKTRK